MNYTNLDISHSMKSFNIKKILIKISITVIFIGIISSIIYIYIYNNKDNYNTRRKLVKIEDDITILYNYTETMSDFLVGDYIIPDIQIHLNLKEENRNLKNSFDEFKNETFRIIENNKKRTESFLKKKALDFLYDNYRVSPSSYIQFNNPEIAIGLNITYDNNYNYKEIDENLERNRQLYFENMLEIDYDNFMVSFGYYNKNEIYNLFNETIEFDYDYVNLKIKNENKYPYWINYYYYLPYSPFNYFSITQIEEQLPYKEWKGLSSKEFRRLTWWSDGIDGYILNKVLTKDEYINKIIRVLSVSPKIFI